MHKTVTGVSTLQLEHTSGCGGSFHGLFGTINAPKILERCHQQVLTDNQISGGWVIILKIKLYVFSFFVEGWNDELYSFEETQRETLGRKEI